MSDAVTGAVTARVPAKINLSLSIGEQRPDGFHPVATVYQAVSVYDEVTASAGTASTQVRVKGPGSALVPTDETNLAVRAAQALAAHHGIDARVALRIRKAIPVAGGMAGGSADAAAALVACDVLWQTSTPLPDLLSLAGSLGSDVPFFLVGGTAVGTGRGEVVTPALARGSFHWVLALADRGLPTPMVYAELDRGRAAQPTPGAAAPTVPPPVMAALRTGDPAALGRALCNDLQPAALRLRPQLRQLLEAGLDRGAYGALVSGSGPTCLFLATDADHALDLAVRLTGTGLCRTALRAVGPVPGARVLG